MKKLVVFLIGTMSFSLGAAAQQNDPGAASAGGASDTMSAQTSDTRMSSAQQSLTDMSPKDICNKFVDIAQGKASDKLLDQLVVQAPKLSRAEEKSLIKRDLGNGSCHSETIAENHAVVVGKSMDNKDKVIPFVKEGGVWKFDPQSFKTIYRMERMPAGKMVPSTQHSSY